MDKLNNDQKKGIDLTIKAITKIFPFIKGGELYEGYEKYDVILYVDLFIDFFEMVEMYDDEIMSGWVKWYEEGGPSELISSALSAFVRKNEDDTSDETFRKYYDLAEKIKQTMNNIYSHLPDNFKIPYENALGGVSDVSISVSEYKQYK